LDILSFIDRSEYFQGVSLKNKEILAEICVPKHLNKKEVIFTEGEKGTAFYFLASGAVGLYKGTNEGKEIVIKIVQPGEPFAEVILFERDTFPVTAVAINPSLVFFIPKFRFYSLLNVENFRNDFISMLMRKQRYLIDKIRHLTLHDVEDRFFLFLEEHFGDKKQIDVTLSKKDIAAAIGTTPETYSRLLARLIEEQKIKVDGRILIICKDLI
jgi:CRP/FNR family transcriptional regulator